MNQETYYVHSPDRDANALLDHALATGVDVPADDIRAIRNRLPGATAKESSSTDQVPVDDGLPGAAATVAAEPAAAEIAFEDAYVRLVRRMWPVTGMSLWATERGPDGARSYAERWSLTLYLVTLTVFVLLCLCAGATMAAGGAINQPIDVVADADVFASRGPWPATSAVTQFCLPFFFGALGACTYLLRTCHKTIYSRTFDPNRKHEYINRIILGFVSGGATGILFARFVVDGTPEAASLSASALGFLAGYNTDLLFTAIERIFAALLPKPEGEPRKQPPTPVAPPGNVAKPKTGARP